MDIWSRGDSLQMTDLGIKTPFLQRTSKLPKGCDPRIYCNGFPFERSWHSWRSSRRHLPGADSDSRGLLRFMAYSRSQRSSFRAAPISLHVRRSWGSRGCKLRARRKREDGRRGMYRHAVEIFRLHERDFYALLVEVVYRSQIR